jgi:uncharacterized membrane protein (DUF2068 family)
MSETVLQEHPAEVEVESTHAHHDRGLLAIALFKLAKSGFFFCLGVGAFKLLHKDLGDVAMQIAQALHRDPEGRFVTLMMEQVDRIDAHRLREIGFATFAYSALALTEGVGLWLEKVWAEYLTTILTMMFLPWELYELARDPGMMRLALLLANLAVLAYLLWLLRRKKQGSGE